MHVFGQLFNAFFRHFHAPTAFERKGLGDHAYSQNAKIFCDFSHNRPCPSACASTHPRGDKDHVCTGQRRANFFARRFGCSTALIGLGACPQPRVAQTNLHGCIGCSQSLRIGIATNEIHPLHTRTDHVRDSIATRTTDTHHFNHSGFFGVI